MDFLSELVAGNWEKGLIVLAGLFVAWGLKKIPNDKIKLVTGKFFYGLGVTVTLGLTKWKWTTGFWNKVAEPYLIDAIENIIGNGVIKFIEGLRSDNKKKK